VGLLASVWAAISGLLGVVASVAGSLAQAQFLGQLLHMWGAPSAVGLQLLLQKLQMVASGLVLAPPQLNRYQETVKGMAWTTDWTRRLPVQPDAADSAWGIQFRTDADLQCPLVCRRQAGGGLPLLEGACRQEGCQY
jgi:hypothetical protein